jgi:hypothetical protein
MVTDAFVQTPLRQSSVVLVRARQAKDPFRSATTTQRIQALFVGTFLAEAPRLAELFFPWELIHSDGALLVWKSVECTLAVYEIAKPYR